MADGEITVKLGEVTARSLRAAADAAGVPIEAYAAQALSRLFDDDLAKDLRIIDDYERTGVSYSVEEAMQHFDNALETKNRRQAVTHADGSQPAAPAAQAM